MASFSKGEITDQLNANHTGFANMVDALDEKEFSSAPTGKWTAGQQLLHIYLSLKPLTGALGMPKIALKALIGTTKRASMDYDGVVEKYREALEKGGVAPSTFVPEPVLYKSKAALIEKLKKNLSKLSDNLSKYSEGELDQILLPHPLLGKLTLREMLYFTIYHVGHHHRATLKNLGR